MSIEKPWLKQSWESDHEYGWFCRYAEMPAIPPPLPILAAMPGAPPLMGGTDFPGPPPAAGYTNTTLLGMCQRNGWLPRAEAWRREKVRRANEAAARRLNAPSETPARVASVTRLQGVLAERELEKHLGVSEATPAPVTSVREASRMAVAAVQLGRLELGAPVALDDQTGPDMSNWTDQEIEEWQAKLSEKARGK